MNKFGIRYKADNTYYNGNRGWVHDAVYAARFSHTEDANMVIDHEGFTKDNVEVVKLEPTTNELKAYIHVLEGRGKRHILSTGQLLIDDRSGEVLKVEKYSGTVISGGKKYDLTQCSALFWTKEDLEKIYNMKEET